MSVRSQGRPRCLTPEEITALSADWKGMMRVIDMAFKYNASPTTLHRIFQQHRAHFPKRPKAASKPLSRQERVSPVPTLFRVPVQLPWYEGGR